MQKLLTLFLILSCGVTAAATLYKWVDKNGVVHYSDRPRPGAEVVNVPSAQTYDAPASPTAATDTANNSKPSAFTGYTEFTLWKPDPDEVFVNTDNAITAKVRLEPPLQPGHEVWLFLDGRRIQGIPGRGTEFQISEVWRGTHTLTATVVDTENKTQIQSQPVTFHVRQTSVLNRPKIPTPPPPKRP